MSEISVIIPVFNGAKFLAEAINSVLVQTVPVAEIIVVDDGSTDDTARIAKCFPTITYIHQENQGTASAVNTGVTKAEGTHFAFLDADDLWLSEKIEKQIDVFHSDAEIGIVFTFIQNFICKSISEATRSTLDVNMAPMPGIQKSTLMVSRKSFFEVGMFLPSSKIDLLDWYARANERGVRQQMIKEVLVQRRIHDENQSIKNKSLAQAFPGIIKSILDRRRT